MKAEHIDIGDFERSFQTALANADVKDGWLMAQCTNRFLLERLQDVRPDELAPELLAHGLDIRIFSAVREIKWIRGSIADREFLSRMTEPEPQTPPADRCWDEEQYLDIDLKRSDPAGQSAVTTGGGRYHLPLACYQDARLKIRNYLAYDEDTGMAYVSDWRLAGLTEGRN